MASWVRWVLNDRGLLGAWHAAARDGVTLCGRAYHVPRVHRAMAETPERRAHGPVCPTCLARAKKGEG